MIRKILYLLRRDISMEDLEELESHWDSLSDRDLRMFQFGVFTGFSDALIIIEGGDTNLLRLNPKPNMN